MHGAAALVTLPVSTVASKQLPDATMVRMHNVPEGIKDHGRTPMDCFLKHSQFGPEYTVVSENRGDASGDITFFFSWEGEMLLHEATIATSKKRDVHCMTRSCS